MNKIKFFSLILVSCFLLAGCGPESPATKGGQEAPKGSPSTADSAKRVTMKEAWEKVKPEADKWNTNYKIASISDVTTAKSANLEGKALGWEFLLEICDDQNFRDICLKGKIKSFYFHAEKVVGESVGVSSSEETPFSSGRPTFEASALVIDSDKAASLSRQAKKLQPNVDEEFKMDIYSAGGKVFWTVGRGCNPLKEQSETSCRKTDNYIVYLDAQSGQIYDQKPKSLD